MRYESTRGEAAAHGFEEVLLAGLAGDGGLFVPSAWPRFEAQELAAHRGQSYPELVFGVMRHFVGSAVPEATLRDLATKSYAGFDHRAVAPLKQLDQGLWLMELFHGPTLAFKDYALQLLGRLFDHALERRGQRLTIVGATSGDTGSAAIEACRDRALIDAIILFPKGRVSEVQRRQMTTVPAANVHAVAVEGTFDDCQDLVKAMFADAKLRQELNLSAVNSINWARIAAQIAFYLAASLALGGPERPLAFAVPTGNFGNAYAGHCARRLGVPIDRLIVGSNRNDSLARLILTGAAERGVVQPSLSPSMDIQVASNLERLLFDLMGRDAAQVRRTLEEARASGRLALGRATWESLKDQFAAHAVDDETTLATMRRIYEETGELIDPHTAVGIAAARAVARDPRVPTVVLATAHPAKFPDAVMRATGRHPDLPARLGDLLQRRERVTVLPNDLAAVTAFVRGKARRAAA